MIAKEISDFSLVLINLSVSYSVCNWNMYIGCYAQV